MAGPSTYRTRLSLRVAVALAGALWMATLAFLAQHPEVAPQTLLSAAAFATFFALSGAHYDRLAITLTAEGIVFHRIGRHVPVRYDEITRITVRSGLAGTFYEVVTRRGPIRFSSLLAHHRELCDALRQRARLERHR